MLETFGVCLGVYSGDGLGGVGDGFEAMLHLFRDGVLLKEVDDAKVDDHILCLCGGVRILWE